MPFHVLHFRILAIALSGIVTMSAAGQCDHPPPAQLIANDAAMHDAFGHAVSVWRDIAVVGAYGDEGPGVQAGSAYIYQRTEGGQWVERQRIRASDPSSFARFGHAVSVSSDTIVVGASLDDENGQNAGAAYVFRRQLDGSWVQEQKLIASDGAQNHEFGWAVAVSGFTMVVGAIHDGDGSAYVFRRDVTGQWTFQQKIVSSGPQSGGHFGCDVATTGNWIFVGAQANENSNGSQAGAVYVFRRDVGGQWVQHQKLIANDGHAQQYFGGKVHADHHSLIVGAYCDGSLGDAAGAAYIFQYGSGDWGQQQKILAFDGAEIDLFGLSVGISGDLALVGAPADDDGADSAGSAYLFRRGPGGAWIGQGKLTQQSPSAFDRFGSVSISDKNAIVGAPYRDDAAEDAGAAYAFRIACNASADVNGDGVVNVADLVSVLVAWGPCPSPSIACPADINLDGIVNVDDLLFVIMAL